MDDIPPRFTVTDRDLMQDYDESKLDRVGPPIGVEQRDAGRPEAARVVVSRPQHTLLDMATEFEFFTPAVILAATCFDRDPVSEVNRLCPPEHADDSPMVIDYAYPFFSGLPTRAVSGVPVDLNRRIYAVRRARWSRVRDTIGGMVMLHRPSHFYARVNYSELRIVDPFALKKQAIVTTLPTVPLTVFGVSSNTAFSVIAEAVYPLLPCLTIMPPHADMVVEATRMLGPAPFG